MSHCCVILSPLLDQTCLLVLDCYHYHLHQHLVLWPIIQFCSDVSYLKFGADPLWRETFRNLFITYNDLIPTTFPKELFLKTPDIVMNNNIFLFGDTFWQQLQRHRHRNASSPNIFHYNLWVPWKYSNSVQISLNILYYKWHIDDIFGIWVDSLKATWEDFKQSQDQFGLLHWNFEDLTTSMSFLDLQISISNGKLHTKTFQKALNLYIIPILHSAATSIDNTQGNRNLLQPKVSSEDILYNHWKYHPTDIKKNDIHKIHNKTLKDHDRFLQMQIATLRPPNLLDKLCHTNIPNLPGRNTSAILSKFRESTI